MIIVKNVCTEGIERPPCMYRACIKPLFNLLKVISCTVFHIVSLAVFFFLLSNIPWRPFYLVLLCILNRSSGRKQAVRRKNWDRGDGTKEQDQKAGAAAAVSWLGAWMGMGGIRASAQYTGNFTHPLAFLQFLQWNRKVVLDQGKTQKLFYLCHRYDGLNAVLGFSKSLLIFH